MAEERLEGGWETVVSRDGAVVYRSAGPQSQTVLRFLNHLHDRGFTGAPRPIGSGFSSDGREQLTYIEGVSPQPRSWSDEAIWSLGRMTRNFHEASAGFEADPSRWKPSFARDLPGTDPVIGHGDLGPWNILAVDGMPTAFIDWDHAGPVDALWELAEVAWLNAQLHDDDVAELNNLGSAEERARQLAGFLDGYGLAGSRRVGFVDRMIEFAIRSAKDEAVQGRVGPSTVSPAPDGFPIVWAVAWRARAAAWMITNRRRLEQAIL